jgi:polyhydroxyalkanoate synthesis regulator phasin
VESANIFGTSAPDTDTSAPDTDTSAPDTDTSAPDDEENILINQLVKTGKFTEDEATEFVTKVMKNGTNGASPADDTLDSDSPSTSETDTSTDETPTTSETDTSTDETPTTSETDTSTDETPTTSETDTSTNDTTSFDNQNNDDESSSNTNNPEEYDDLNGLVDDIKNGDIDTDEISLNAFQDSGAYQGTDKETQDCIDLAGKIGQNLGDHEIVHCFDDANYFRDKYLQVSVPQDKVPQPIPEPEPTVLETNATQQVPQAIPEPEPTVPETNATQQVPEPKPEPNATQQVPEPKPEPNVAEEYDQMEDLVDDIKNGDLDDDEILLNDFIDSGAYQDANKNIQDCIRLAGKIGQNLGDNEIAHCFDDANYFRDKYPQVSVPPDKAP